MTILTSVTARLVIGHRGNAAHAPENTLASFEQAVALGADAIEFDVRITRDGIPVVIHDATLGRTTDRAEAVNAVTLAEVREANAGARFSPDGGSTFPYRSRGVTIPTVAEVVQRFPETPLLIEVKVPEAAEPLFDVLAAEGALERAVFGSMALEAVLPFRRRGLPTGASSGEVVRLLPAALFGLGKRDRLPYDALCIPRWYNGFPVPVGALARAGRAGQAVTHVWTIDSPAVAKRLWRRGIQGIVTNDPATMIRIRDEVTEL